MPVDTALRESLQRESTIDRTSDTPRGQHIVLTDHSSESDLSTDAGSGVVIRKNLGAYHVQTARGVVVCAISNRLRKQLIYPIADVSSIGHHRVVKVEDIDSVDPVAIGDEVELRHDDAGRGMITAVRPRRSKLSRPASGRKPLEQVVVANLDQMIAVIAAARPEPKWNLLDRYLVSAEASGVEALICITKIDLADMEAIEGMLQPYHAMGYRVLLTSAETGAGIDALRAALADKLSVFIGKSGVGKTSLLNAMEPGLGARVGSVSEGRTGKGKHTTTHVEMAPLRGGGAVVDTPGMRAFGLWEVDDSDLASYFRDLAPFTGSCRFGPDCAHETEPGCAVRAAVERGEVEPRRYASYLRLLHGQDE